VLQQLLLSRDRFDDIQMVGDGAEKDGLDVGMLRHRNLLKDRWQRSVAKISGGDE
jgi:hypothetical protein